MVGSVGPWHGGTATIPLQLWGLHRLAGLRLELERQEAAPPVQAHRHGPRLLARLRRQQRALGAVHQSGRPSVQ